MKVNQWLRGMHYALERAAALPEGVEVDVNFKAADGRTFDVKAYTQEVTEFGADQRPRRVRVVFLEEAP